MPRRSVYGLIERGKVAGVLNVSTSLRLTSMRPCAYHDSAATGAVLPQQSFVAEQSRALAARLTLPERLILL